MPTPGFTLRNHQPIGTPLVNHFVLSQPPPSIDNIEGSVIVQEKEHDDTGEEIDEQDDMLTKNERSFEDSEEENLEDCQKDNGDAEVPLRRSNRLWLKTEFTFKNTLDDPVSLDDNQILWLSLSYF